MVLTMLTSLKNCAKWTALTVQKGCLTRPAGGTRGRHRLLEAASASAHSEAFPPLGEMLAPVQAKMAFPSFNNLFEGYGDTSLMQ